MFICAGSERLALSWSQIEILNRKYRPLSKTLYGLSWVFAGLILVFWWGFLYEFYVDPEFSNVNIWGPDWFMGLLKQIGATLGVIFWVLGMQVYLIFFVFVDGYYQKRFSEKTARKARKEIDRIIDKKAWKPGLKMYWRWFQALMRISRRPFWPNAFTGCLVLTQKFSKPLM